MAVLMAFHAHPDDETTSTGGVLARYSDGGHTVIVVTATDGAVGEIHNYQNAQELRSRLADLRRQELAEAAEILGIHVLESLGYRDSGMMGTPDNDHPDSFWRADFEEAVGRMVTLIRSHRPDVVIAYDPFGGYGHPDHIQVSRVGTASYLAAADTGRYPADEYGEPWHPAKLYWATFPRRRTEEMRKILRDAGLLDPEVADRPARFGLLDDFITTRVDVARFLDRKWAAWKAHRSQIPQDWWAFQVPDAHRAEVFGRETFVRVFTSVEAPLPEDDLLSGVT